MILGRQGAESRLQTLKDRDESANAAYSCCQSVLVAVPGREWELWGQGANNGVTEGDRRTTEELLGHYA